MEGIPGIPLSFPNKQTAFIHSTVTFASNTKIEIASPCFSKKGRSTWGVKLSMADMSFTAATISPVWSWVAW
jgi:hypothetical protein